MDMVLSNEFLEMNSMELGEVSGGILNNLQVMYVSPNTSLIAQNTPIGGLYLPGGSAVVSGAVTAVLACLNDWQ